MFYGATSFNQNLESWRVANMESTFCNGAVCGIPNSNPVMNSNTVMLPSVPSSGNNHHFGTINWVSFFFLTYVGGLQ